MTRQELLSMAQQQFGANNPAIELAKVVSQVKEAEALRAQLEAENARDMAKGSRWSKLAFYSFLGFAILTAACLAVAFSGHAAWLDEPGVNQTPLVFIGLFILGSAGVLGATKFMVKTHELRTKIAYLTPIAGRDVCQVTVRYIEAGYPAVLTWRDIAMEERGELYGFDVEVLSSLYHREIAKRGKAHQDEQNDAALRKIHSLGRRT